MSDLALTNVDLVGRTLYERSCNVRWRATDSGGADALTRHTDGAYRFCSYRFGLILNPYTVYYDLVLCDMDGKVVANRRPKDYKSQGMSCAGTEWFPSVPATKSEEEFGFQSVHFSPLANGNRALVYSCFIRAGGDVHGKPLGVLGIVFNWVALAQTIVYSAPLSPEQKIATRVS